MHIEEMEAAACVTMQAVLGRESSLLHKQQLPARPGPYRCIAVVHLFQLKTRGKARQWSGTALSERLLAAIKKEAAP